MDIESKEFKRLTREIARRNNVDPDIARNVFISQFEYARISMKKMRIIKSYYPYVLFPYFLTFRILPGKIKHFTNNLKNRKIDVHSEKGDTED